MRIVVIVAILSALLSPTMAGPAWSGPSVTNGDGRYHAGELQNTESRAAEVKWQMKRGKPSAKPTSQVKTLVIKRELCADGSLGVPILGCWTQALAETNGCPTGVVVNYIPGETLEVPLESLGVGVLPSQCRASAGAAPVIPSAQMVLEEFKVLPLTGSGVSYQPADGMAVINLPFVAYTSGASQTVQTTILGTAVTIEATPVGFAWDYGDDSAVFKTKDPNRPYPNHAYEHVFAHVGKARVTLTTTWSGRYSLNGSTWQAIAGTTTTTEVSAPITVNEILIYNTN